MLIFEINDKNFSDIKNQSETLINNITTKIEKQNNKIIISINTLVPFAIYKWELDNHFCISNKLQNILNYIKSIGYHIEYDYNIIKTTYYGRKNSIDQIYYYKNITIFNNWKEIHIDTTGNIKIIKNDPVFNINIDSEHGIDNLLKWIKKYYNLAKKLIDENKFIPSLTGGIDTRILTYFWRNNKDKLENYYLISIKNDYKAMLKKGIDEIKIVETIEDYLNINLKRTEKIENNLTTFSGQFTEHSYKDATLNDPNFIYDYISLHFMSHDSFYTNNIILPFIDDLFIQLTQPKKYFMRVLLSLLMCNDLTNIEYYSLSKYGKYEFDDKYKELIIECNDFINKWDLRNKLNKLSGELLC